MLTRIRLLGGCLALTGCASTTPRPAVSRPGATHPQVLELTLVNGLSGYHVRCLADGEAAWFEQYKSRRRFFGWTEVITGRIERHPSAARWGKFWRTVESLQIPRWKADYNPMDVNGMILSDGTFWAVTLSTPRQVYKSGGYEAFPVKGHPQRTALSWVFRTPRKYRQPGEVPVVIEKNSFDPLEQAFDELLAEPRRH